MILVISMQYQINQIINDKAITHKDKLNRLKKLFTDYKIHSFSDLDDTITQNQDVFCTKVKLINKLVSNKKKYYWRLISNFIINQQFLNIIKKHKIKEFVIITRNRHDFLELFIKKTKYLFESKWIKIQWWIWVSDDFNIKSKDKLKLIPDNSTIISDMFEYNALKSYNKFICIDDFNYYNYIKISFYKLYKLVIFLFTDLIK